jgi:hypothetical protein
MEVYRKGETQRGQENRVQSSFGCSRGLGLVQLRVSVSFFIRNAIIHLKVKIF